jgi:hypothetical protein
MLTIKNLTKIWKCDVGNWRIGKVETQSYCYMFTLFKNNSGERLQINLERQPIGLEYELWYWKIVGGQSPHPNSTPERMLLSRDKLITPNVLIGQMEKLIKVV